LLREEALVKRVDVVFRSPVRTDNYATSGYFLSTSVSD